MTDQPHLSKQQLSDECQTSDTVERRFVTFPLKIPQLKNRFVILPGDDAKAREIAVAIFGWTWCFIYPIEDLEYQCDMFGLREIDVNDAYDVLAHLSE